MVPEAGIVRISLLLKINGNFEFEKFSTSMCTLSLRADSVLSVATGFHRQVKTTKVQTLTVQNLVKAWLLNGMARKDGNAELQRRFNKDL